ncbi:hypothetical protein BAUCODRAFT_34720 [Baudoinia panamericana UAMH 10762]|uniref:DNA replication regulator SLD2 n=1 Tax=Baudoinia panamericana (strain UAMH 10762) TaxID=717646 RepID=M2N9Z7_BAUPA|nr:uncharacterized protein BAUCODRAFT_34720 [Baudoinia panamericana UAMH 10762]EMC95959.1 hypothetical protein BAUCODRAFT_34720 [Baudoinia panamericana UAMH 10762]
MSYGEETNAAQLTSLKHELKAWEKVFAIDHDGRKPSRDDIRQDASISAKYKAYNALRTRHHDEAAHSTPKRGRQRRLASDRERTVLRERCGNAVAATPRKTRGREVEKHEVENQVIEPTPAFIRCALGPTPQKDGQVLSIFDIGLSATPSKRDRAIFTAEADAIIASTPSKQTRASAAGPEQALSATPQSSGKRRLLDAFAGTPLKRQRLEDGSTPGTARPKYATPSFLRRSFPLAAIEEDAASEAPPPFKKRGGFVRSLSSIIQGLRKHEEERMDDEWDVLNELEAEERGEPKPVQKAHVLVAESQGMEMPLGPDQGTGEDAASDSEAEVVLGADGKPRKPWKKKGLKRQTKRVIMRPVMHRPKKAEELQRVDEADEEAVAETQTVEKADGVVRDGDQAAQVNKEEASGSDFETNGAAHKRDKKKRLDEGNVRQGDAEKASPKQRVAKKVSATAHANFRALKIKNKHSKANGRGGGRGKFGRRR